MFKIIVSTVLVTALVTEAWHFWHKTNRPTKNNLSSQKNKIFNHTPVSLEKEINYVDHLNGYEFEDYTAWLLKWNGFVGIKQTGKDHDFGLDVLAYKHHIAYGIQCKHYKNRKIKRQVIKHTADGAHFYRTKKAIVLTNTGFDRPAIRAHKFFHVELWDREKLIKLIQRAITNHQLAKSSNSNKLM